jgi:2-dehydropantoate 2-reductase
MVRGEKRMRIAVVGAGAVGGYFGAQLAASDADVVFLARGPTLAALRDSGLRVESPEGNLRLRPVEATDQPSEAGVADAVLVAVKAWQVPEVGEWIRPLVGDKTAVLPLQNGVEAADQLAEIYGPERALGGICRIVATQVAPGHIRHLGVEPYIALGDLRGKPNQLAEALLQALTEADIWARIPFDIRSSIWQKMLFVAPVSGVGAVTRAAIGTIRALPETRDMLRQAMTEICMLAAAKRITLRDDAIERTLSFLDGMEEEATTSMQRNLMEGRPSELEALNGAVVRIGRSLGIATPINGFLYASLLPAERLARGADG